MPIHTLNSVDRAAAPQTASRPNRNIHTLADLPPEDRQDPRIYEMALRLDKFERTLTQTDRQLQETVENRATLATQIDQVNSRVGKLEEESKGLQERIATVEAAFTKQTEQLTAIHKQHYASHRSMLRAFCMAGVACYTLGWMCTRINR